jgi:ABC-type lipoprotein export system ATPase subunit
MLVAQSLRKLYRGEQAIEAVSNVNLQIEQGSFVAVIGRSGSGKSTLLGMLGGIARPTSGSLIINGVNQWELNANARSDFRNQKIGFVFQCASLLPTLRAIDNVALPALVGGELHERAAYSRARALLERVGLKDRVDFYPSELSGGEQRRVAIARALINEPSTLLTDEPTADLDAETEAEILDLLVDIHTTFDLTLVVVTHNPAIAERADQVLRMQNGKLMEHKIQEQAETPSATNASKEARRLQRIFDRSPDEIAAEQMRLGEGIERLLGKFILWLIPFTLIVWGINAGIGNYQTSVIDAKAEQRLALEDLSMKGLRADIKEVVFGPGDSYVVSLYLRNTTGDRPLYIMSPAVRAFVQVESSWQEVPIKPLDVPASKVQNIKGESLFKYSIEPNVSRFAQLIPYYMHVRISNDLLVSLSSRPRGDLIERNDNYYVYLKPHRADDRAILQKLKFPGVPPVWIPMPPH